MILPILIFLLSLSYRFAGILDNHPFWVDEFSSANQARLLLEYGSSYFNNPLINVEFNNVIAHSLIALSFAVFGQNEWVARLPFVLIGSLVPVATFFLARLIFGTPVGVIASLLTSTSYFLITWSRQARSYPLTQLCMLLTLYFYFRITSQKNPQKYLLALFIAVSLFGVLTHYLFWILLGTLFLDSLFRFRTQLKTIVKNPLFFVGSVVLFFTLMLFGIPQSLFNFMLHGMSPVNNAWYYHSFLWREYGLISFLAFMGILGSFKKHFSSVSIVVGYMIIHVLFLVFFFPPYTSRYLLPIFPLLFIFTAFTLNKFMNAAVTVNFAGIKREHLSMAGTLFLTAFIILNGYKFDIKPNPFYSVNHDFREIALIDYKQVYDIIKEKGDLDEGKTAVIDTWHDRLYWYLGTDFYAPYIFRWAADPGTTNGLSHTTRFIINKEGEKLIPRQERLILIAELSDLKKAMNKYPKGFIFIDDASMPADVIKYVQENFHQELFLNRYPLDDNPLSDWPATLYSWGIEESLPVDSVQGTTTNP